MSNSISVIGGIQCVHYVVDLLPHAPFLPWDMVYCLFNVIQSPKIICVHDFYTPISAFLNLLVDIWNFALPACSAGKMYKSCGTACPKTCANYSEPSKGCSSQCVPGCFCPPGTVEHNGQCINPLSCPLTHKTSKQHKQNSSYS